MIDPNIIEKACIKCHLQKFVAEFPTVRRTYKEKIYTYLNSWCKKCIRDHTSIKKKEERKKAGKQERIPGGRERTLEWGKMSGPVSWSAFKGSRITSNEQTARMFPVHSCGRKYMSELGCIWCTRITKSAALSKK